MFAYYHQQPLTAFCTQRFGAVHGFFFFFFFLGREHFQWNTICRNAANKKQETQRDSTIDTACEIHLFP